MPPGFNRLRISSNASRVNSFAGPDSQADDGSEITTLTITAGQTFGSLVNGAELPVLQSLSNLTLDILAVGTTFPGRDLTVTIRV